MEQQNDSERHRESRMQNAEENFMYFLPWLESGSNWFFSYICRTDMDTNF